MKKILFMFSLLIISFISGCTNGKEFTIQFETYTGSEIDDIIYEEGSLFELPNIPLKEGHEFLSEWTYFGQADGLLVIETKGETRIC